MHQTMANCQEIKWEELEVFRSGQLVAEALQIAGAEVVRIDCNDDGDGAT